MPHVIVNGALAWQTDAQLEAAAAKAKAKAVKAEPPKPSKSSTILKA